MRDTEVSKLIYDVYNKKWKVDGISGTITGNCGCPTGCGCMFVVVKVNYGKVFMDKASD